jgi:hypothetical protein
VFVNGPIITATVSTLTASVGNRPQFEGKETKSSSRKVVPVPVPVSPADTGTYMKLSENCILGLASWPSQSS